MKKNLFVLLINYLCFCLFSEVINDSQLIESEHWIYDDFKILSSETCNGNFMTNTPATVGELKMSFSEYDRDLLSPEGQLVYDRAEKFLFTQKNLFQGKIFEAGLGFTAAPEVCYKSNEQIDWTYNYYYKNNPLSMDAGLGISDYFSIGGNYFIGKNYKAAADSKNFTNIPLGYDQFEFMFPRFAFGSLGYAAENWGVNLNVGKEGLTIGNTKTGSIIYNKSFETDCYVQLTAYSNDVKYTMNVAEISADKFIYFHQLDVRLFKKFKIGVLEGALVNKPFELRFFNPMVVFHSFAFWKDYINDDEDHFYNEGYCCSYLGVTFEANPVRYLRFYGLYAMNEIQLPNEHEGKWLSYPDSLGAQLGAELMLPSDFGGYWKAGLEAVYCSPFLYIKQSPDWSLYRQRQDNVTWNKVNSWIGSPFGPDTFAIDASFEYEQLNKWSAGFEYLLCFKGENGFNLFDERNRNAHSYKKDNKERNAEVWDYYPYTKYTIADDADNEEDRSKAIKEGRNMWMSGVCETKHQLGLEGSYSFTKKIRLQGQVIYSFVINACHKKNNFQHGFQGALSFEYKLF